MCSFWILEYYIIQFADKQFIEITKTQRQNIDAY